MSGLSNTLNSVHLFVIAVSTVLFAGCGGTKPSPPSGRQATIEQIAGEDQLAEKNSSKLDFQTLYQREFPSLPLVEIGAMDHSWRAQVEASERPSVSVTRTGATDITVPVGLDSPITCLVYQSAMDVGATIREIFEYTAREHNYHHISPNHVGVAGRYPTLAAVGIYTTEISGNYSAGVFKVAIHAHSSHPIMCYQDALGYNESFLRVVTGLFDSFQSDSVEPVPDYVEIWTTFLAEVPVGFSELRIYRNSDGTRTSKNLSTLVVPVKPTVLQIGDEYTMAKSNNEGTLTNKKTVRSLNGSISLDMNIEPVNGPEYRYRGVVKGEPVEGRFLTSKKSGLAADWHTMLKVKETMKKLADERFSRDTYFPLINPINTVEANYSISGSTRPQSMIQNIGRQQTKWIADKNSDLAHLSIATGLHELTMKRAYLQGEILDLK